MAKVKFTIEDWRDIKVGQKVIFRHQNYFGVPVGTMIPPRGKEGREGEIIEIGRQQSNSQYGMLLEIRIKWVGGDISPALWWYHRSNLEILSPVASEIPGLGDKGMFGQGRRRTKAEIEAEERELAAFLAQRF